MPSSLERKLVVGILALFLIPTLAAGAIVLWLYRRGALETPAALALTVAIGFVTMMAYLGIVAHGIGRGLVRQLQAIQLGTELIATVNPDHRLDVHTGDELESLAAEINRMADRLLAARTGLEAAVTRATALLEIERGKLSAVLDALGEGVAVATIDGRVVLANPAAHDLLGAAPGALLGQSLFAFVDREKIAHYLERIGAAAGTAERFSLLAAGGAVLESVMTSFFDGARGVVGFVLVLRDVTRPARSEQERQRRLTETLRDLRGPLASVRSLSESLLEAPEASGDTARRLVAAIHAEAVRMSEVVSDTATAEQRGLRAPPRHFETLAVADLLAMTRRRAAPELAPAIVVVADPDAGTLPPLRGEASTLSAGLAHLVGVVASRGVAGGRVALRPRRHGGVIQIDVSGEGAGEAAELETFLDAPVAFGPAGAVAVRDVVRHHAGEAWAYAGGGRLGFRITLPIETGPGLVEGTPAARAGFAGVGLASGASAGARRPPRPDYYDFSLVDEMERRLGPGERNQALESMVFTVFDTETTGLDPDGADRIVSLAAVRVRGGVVKRGEIFDALVNPGRPIPPASVAFHGITDEMVAEAPPLEVVLPAFLGFAEGSVLVGHQVWFDLRFLAAAARRLGRPPVTAGQPVFDTLSLSEIVHGPFETHELETVAERLGVAVEGRHSALGDALTTAEIFVRLLTLLRKRGVATLGQALEATRRIRGTGTGPGVTARGRP